MNTIIEWDYEQSVNKVSELLGNLKLVTLKKSTLTDEIVRELYEARDKLRTGEKGGRPQLTVTNDTVNSWSQYLKDCGLQRMTVHRWLEHYEPNEQRLLTDEEYNRKIEIKKRCQCEDAFANKKRVNERIRTGREPEDWNDECQELYDRQIEENKQRDENIRQAKIRMESAESNSQKRKERIAELLNDDEINELLKEHEKTEKVKEEFRNKVGLTGDNATHDFNDFILNYLNTLKSDSQKIEACHNIIKICKGIVSELQQQSVR